jgi:hypothetical protein
VLMGGFTRGSAPQPVQCVSVRDVSNFGPKRHTNGILPDATLRYLAARLDNGEGLAPALHQLKARPGKRPVDRYVLHGERIRNRRCALVTAPSVQQLKIVLSVDCEVDEGPVARPFLSIASSLSLL